MRIFFRSKWVIFGAVLILLIILVVLTKIAFTPIPKIIDLCAPLPIIKGEISCKEAEQIALAKYPGEITHINLKSENVSTPTGIPPKLETVKREIWLLVIALKTPILLPSAPSVPQDNKASISSGEKVSSIEVAVDRLQGKIIFYRTK